LVKGSSPAVVTSKNWIPPLEPPHFDGFPLIPGHLEEDFLCNYMSIGRGFVVGIKIKVKSLNAVIAEQYSVTCIVHREVGLCNEDAIMVS
jgi:hypothetical protein